MLVYAFGWQTAELVLLNMAVLALNNTVKRIENIKHKNVFGNKRRH